MERFEKFLIKQLGLEGYEDKIKIRYGLRGSRIIKFTELEFGKKNFEMCIREKNDSYIVIVKDNEFKLVDKEEVENFIRELVNLTYPYCFEEIKNYNYIIREDIEFIKEDNEDIIIEIYIDDTGIVLDADKLKINVHELFTGGYIFYRVNVRNSLKEINDYILIMFKPIDNYIIKKIDKDILQYLYTKAKEFLKKAKLTATLT